MVGRAHTKGNMVRTPQPSAPSWARLCVTLALVAGVSRAMVEDDLITSLPGWDGDLPSDQYSGLVNTQSELNATYHYWLVESESEDPTKDPLVMWLNGGPGASSMFGMLTEVGPLALSEDSFATDPPSMFYNDLAWTNAANLLAIDQPPPSGFSYCHDPTAGFDSCGNWTDESAAQEHYVFLLQWFNAYPEYDQRPFFITGESYAGVYVPLLADLVYEGMKAGENTINFQGMAVGDGVIRPSVKDSEYRYVEFMYGHGQTSQAMYDGVMNTCTEEALKDGTYASVDGCSDVLSDMKTSVGGYYEYALYDKCNHDDDADASAEEKAKAMRRRALARRSGGVGDAENDYACGGDDATDAWADRTDVREALHVQVDASWNNVDGDWPEYKSTASDLVSLYAKWANESDLRVLIYNGDTDPMIMMRENEEWTSGMGFDEKESWRPWVYTREGEQHVGGYVTRYQTPGNSTEAAFDFLTIRGSGHMVPQMQPEAALEFFTKWVNNEDWTPYTDDAAARPPSVDGRSPRAKLAALRGGLSSRKRVFKAKAEAAESELAEQLRVRGGS